MVVTARTTIKSIAIVVPGENKLVVVRMRDQLKDGECFQTKGENDVVCRVGLLAHLDRVLAPNKTLAH